MASILDKIVEVQEEELRKRKREVSLRDFNNFPLYEEPRRDFNAALRSSEAISIIAELKKASPSKGVIRTDFQPEKLAVSYAENGASAISVLTEKPHFLGDLNYLARVRGEVELPLLRKDFIIDPYQIEEARAFGADAVLLIVKITDGSQLNELQAAAGEAGLATLVECYDHDDLARIDLEPMPVVGANNRNLETFEVALHHGLEILNKTSESTITVSESGIHSAEDLVTLTENKIDAALIGEYFMKQEDPGKALHAMLSRLSEKLEKTQNS